MPCGLAKSQSTCAASRSSDGLPEPHEFEEFSSWRSAAPVAPSALAFPCPPAALPASVGHSTEHVGQDIAQLHVGPFQNLLDPVALLRSVAHQLPSPAGQIQQ